MQETPRANRLHIGLFGKRNSGKSSLINALTNQEVALVSDIAGTTTDPVYKAMEIHGIGPCVFIDTAGLDDEGELGALRIQQTMRAMDRTDIALLVCTGDDIEKELEWSRLLKEKNIPVWIRHVVVPGITLQEKYLRQLGAYLAGLDNLKALDVLPYHTMGEVKYENLGIPYPLKGVEPATTEQAIWAKNIILDALKERLRKEKFGE